MIVGVGTDLVQIARLREALTRHGERVLRRLFSEGERGEMAERPLTAASIASRFAAKEAAFKALGTGWGQGVGWHEVQVRGGGREAPRLVLTGRAREIAEKQGIGHLHVSLSHDGEYALAFVVAVGEEAGRSRRRTVRR